VAKIERSVTINAPVEKVFGLMNDPEKLPEYWPSVVEVKNVQSLPNGGNRFDGVYKMVGIRLNITNEDTEFVRNQRVVSKSKGGIDATQTFNFESVPGGTKLNWTIEYTMPVPVLGKLAETIVAKMNEREADVVIANIKDRLEA
jgi:uncharacterized membrane protein